jgi:uncharacterized protein
MTPILYLHGFASSPASKKARIFQERFRAAGRDLEVPNLAEDGFRHLTISGQLAVIEHTARGRAVSLIGSSMGGYLAALYAARHPEVEKLVLLAPAFGFARLWAESLGAEQLAAWERDGSMPVMNYAEGCETPLDWQLMVDARRFEEEPAMLQPCLIYHGVHDTVVPVQVSRAFARTRTCVELREVDSDHELMNVVDEMWLGAQEFLAG